MSDKIAHLGFIQATIARMGVNSFVIKGWSITLVAAVFALSAKDSNKSLVLLAYFPVVMFWGLDSFFLHQEKLFRKLYERVADDTVASTLFTMDTSVVTDQVPSLLGVMFSKTIWPFYIILGLLIIITMAFLFNIQICKPA